MTHALQHRIDRFERLICYIVPRLSRDKEAATDMLIAELMECRQDGLRDALEVVSTVSKIVNEPMVNHIETALSRLIKLNEADDDLTTRR